ncbi:MAG: alpha/beta hydrolase [Dongiaceae bacterium]
MKAPEAQGGFLARDYHGQDGLRLHARDYGDPGATALPLLCLPGLTRNSADFHPLALRLRGNRRLLCPDYRGRGLSERDPDPANYVPETYLCDLHHLLIVADVPRAVIVGTSFGGLLAMGLAAAHPTAVAGVVLNDIGPTLEDSGTDRILHAIGSDRPQPDWDGALAWVRATLPPRAGLDEAQLERFTAGSFRRGEDGLLHVSWDVRIVAALARARAAKQDLWALYGGLRDVPVLVLRGGESDLLSAATLARMAEAHPDCRTVTVPGVGHVPPLDHPLVIEAIDDFISRF